MTALFALLLHMMNEEKALIITTAISSFILMLNIGFNNYVPICTFSKSVESIFDALSFGSVIFFSFLYGMIVQFKKNNLTVLCTLIMIPLCVLSVFSYSSRSFVADRQFWQFEGIVTNKYITKSRSAKTITIDDIDYKWMPANVWDEICIGDTVKKMPCCKTVTINGRKIAFSLGHRDIFNKLSSWLKAKAERAINRQSAGRR